MDARKVIEKLKGEADRERTSLYLSKSIMAEFKDACGDIAPSRVMEELMKEFIDSKKLQSTADETVRMLKNEELQRLKNQLNEKKNKKPNLRLLVLELV